MFLLVYTSGPWTTEHMKFYTSELQNRKKTYKLALH